MYIYIFFRFVSMMEIVRRFPNMIHFWTRYVYIGTGVEFGPVRSPVETRRVAGWACRRCRVCALNRGDRCELAKKKSKKKKKSTTYLTIHGRPADLTAAAAIRYPSPRRRRRRTWSLRKARHQFFLQSAVAKEGPDVLRLFFFHDILCIVLYT